MNLAHHNFVPLLDAVAIPIAVVFGLTVAFNSLIVGSLVFSGLMMWLLLRRHKISDGMAFLQFAMWLSLLLIPYTLVHVLRLDPRQRARVIAPGALTLAVCGALVRIAPLPQLHVANFNNSATSGTSEK